MGSFQRCTGMVVVKKKTGAVRICVDLKPLNESVLWEVHPKALAQLASAAIFSKFNTNSGFWQILLSPTHNLCDTLWVLLLQQAAVWDYSPPELFQRRMNFILEGLDMPDGCTHLWR